MECEVSPNAARRTELLGSHKKCKEEEEQWRSSKKRFHPL